MIEQLITAAKMIGGIVLGEIFILVVWSIYSARMRKSLRNGDFAVMELLSETRSKYGDVSRIPSIAGRFGRSATVSDLERSYSFLAGHESCVEEISKSGNGGISVVGDGNLAVSYTPDGKKHAIYCRRGGKGPTKLSLRELVSEKTAMIEIEEDAFKRMNWGDRIEECLPVLESKKTPNIEGSFTFCHRDYVNNEELFGMMRKRRGIETFLFKPSCAGVLTIDDKGECVLLEKTKLFCSIPISVVWKGKLENGTIDWYATSLTVGWNTIRKFFDKPAAAEKLRKDPWHISIPKDDSTGDILCFEREGKGHIVFTKEKCFTAKPKSE